MFWGGNLSIYLFHKHLCLSRRTTEIDAVKTNISKNDPQRLVSRTHYVLGLCFSNVIAHTGLLGMFLTCRCGVAHRLTGLWGLAILTFIGWTRRLDTQAGIGTEVLRQNPSP
jgi:hypothetical protein